jgi:CHAD domain-containing protein
MLDPAWAEPLRAELAWLGDALGAARDLDVLREHLGEEAARLDRVDARAGTRLIRVLEAERARVRNDLLVSLRSDRYLQLLQALEVAAQKPHVTDAVVSLEAMARAAFKTLRRAARRLSDEPSDEALHDLRIKTKRARYAAELVAPTVGKLARRFVAKAKSFQDALGEHQDAVVAQARVRELAARARGAAAAFVAGRLLERQIARRAEILGQIPRRWRKLEKRGTRAWR